MTREECLEELAEALYVCFVEASNKHDNKMIIPQVPWSKILKTDAELFEMIAEELASRFSFQPLCRMTVTVDPEWDLDNNCFKGMSNV